MLARLLPSSSLLSPDFGGKERAAGPLAPLDFHLSIAPLLTPWSEKSQSLGNQSNSESSVYLFCFSSPGPEQPPDVKLTSAVLCGPLFLCLLAFLFPLLFQFSSVQSLSPVRLCNPMNRSMPGLPVHHQLLEFTQTHAH